MRSPGLLTASWDRHLSQMPPLLAGAQAESVLSLAAAMGMRPSGAFKPFQAQDRVIRRKEAGS